ncbi:TIGR04283 family arsenosugar biosynthesis glycosyltransferase [Caulobacter sp. 17J80-11]|uniref:TIGR04283 family arsenosugar biosynthesis glycosyltransferase n=1 Tax=Caulobacter sp. 17J80-11 TaxID=2763502 RepID=UPI0016536512|nr:TIGR04283 family arsenosugar biosynthesis glycosyltransferase [Caulobacter sp. 17J80-11]
MISVVIPTLNAGPRLAETLAALVPGVVEGLIREVVIADAGWTDETRALADASGARLVEAERGRGAQLRAGCAAAKGPWLLILHADTRLEPGWIEAVRDHLQAWPDRAGYFRLGFDDAGAAARLWAAGVAVRNRLFGLVYGDQGLLLPQALYDKVGGYPDWPLLEDVEIVRRLGRGRLRPLAARAVTSAERFRREGWLARTAGNWAILARFLVGADPRDLAKRYERGR